MKMKEKDIFNYILPNKYLINTPLNKFKGIGYLRVFFFIIEPRSLKFVTHM